MIPVITLNNGIRVANFSSPHSFTFNDGSVLPSCTEERSRTLSLEKKEECTHISIRSAKIRMIKMSFIVPEPIRKELEQIENNPDIDLVIIPFPMLEACRNVYKKAVVCSTVDRINKIIDLEGFCQ